MGVQVNNFNSSIGVQTVVDGSNSDGSLVAKYLADIRRMIFEDKTHSSEQIAKLSALVDQVQSNLQRPKHDSADVIERGLSALGSSASLVSLVDQIRPFLKNMF